MPGLLDAAQGVRSAELLVPAYRITSSLLVKLGGADLARLAADRAVATAEDNQLVAATAAIAVAQALRASHRDHLALAAALTAANRILPPTPTNPTPSRPGDHDVDEPGGDRTTRPPHDHGGEARPLTRTVIADVVRAQPAPAGVARLATLVGLTRRPHLVRPDP
ncbi:hypothetical protein [Micromonospora sp. NPDC005203]|uniref:hypothetical protein n=1 Tax=Micromonospora sp. NPDC005203 TaxID=3364226 RepID=UPI003682BBF1